MYAPLHATGFAAFVLQHLLALLSVGVVFGSVWTYTVGGTKFGDRVMAMRWYMQEGGYQKVWNELFLFVNRVIGSNVTLSGGRTTFGEIDFAAAGDVTTAIPRTFADPAGPNVNVFRQMPGYPTGQVQEVLFDGFVG